MSVIWHAHSTRDYLFTGFIIFSAAAVAVRAVTTNEFFNDAEANRSDLTKPIKATPLNRTLIVIFCAFVIGVAVLQFLR